MKISHIHVCIYRQAESLDHHFSPPINNSLKSLKLGKILKIYYAKLVYYLLINIYIQCCVYAITLHTSLMNMHTHTYIYQIYFQKVDFKITPENTSKHICLSQK